MRRGTNHAAGRSRHDSRAVLLPSSHCKRGAARVLSRNRERNCRAAGNADPYRADGALRSAPRPTACSTAPAGCAASRSRCPASSSCRSAAAPAGGRDVVAWAHPTTGVVPRCAPSLSPCPVPADPGAARHDLARLRRRRDRLSGPRHAGPPSLTWLASARVARCSIWCAPPAPCRVWAPAAASPSGAIRRAGTPCSIPACCAALCAGASPAGVAAAAPATELGTLFKDDLAHRRQEPHSMIVVVLGARLWCAHGRVVDSAAMPTLNQLSQECIELDRRRSQSRANRAAPAAPVPVREKSLSYRAVSHLARTQHARHAASRHSDFRRAGPGRYAGAAAGDQELRHATVPRREPRALPADGEHRPRHPLR